MRFLLHGPDTFRMRRKLDSVRSQFMKTRDSSGMNVSRLIAKEHDADTVAEAFFSSPFLAERKLIILEGFLQAPATKQEEVATLLQKMPDSVVAIFLEDADTKDLEKSPLYPLLAPEKFSEHFPALTGRDLEKFCIDEAKAENVTLAPREAQLLVAALGDDLARLHGEIAKLCAHAQANGRNIIDHTSLLALVPEAVHTDIFGFVDACTHGNCAPATKMLENLLQNGFSTHQIITLLEKQFRLLVAASDATRNGTPDQYALAKSLGIHNFPASKALSAVKNRPHEWFTTRHATLLEIDRTAKSTTLSIPALLATFINRLK